MQTTPVVSIILPCFNPLEGWLKTIDVGFSHILKENIVAELIIVNDGSSKNFNEQETRAFFKSQPQVKVISYQLNRGKGYALRQGVVAASGDFVIYTDIDFPYTHQSFLKIFNKLKDNGCEVVVGIRSEEYYTHLPKMRVYISKFLRLMIRKFLRIPTDDTQCGLKGFNRKGKEIFLQTTIDRYLFDLEFIFLSARKKVGLKTVVVELREGIELSRMRWPVLLQEFGNFLKIFARSIF
jgi:glycosyltransferase involved in cell wall biosynthesis